MKDYILFVLSRYVYLIFRLFKSKEIISAKDRLSLSCVSCCVPYNILCKGFPCNNAKFDLKHKIYSNDNLQKGKIFHEHQKNSYICC
jgi:hypothetical protein